MQPCPAGFIDRLQHYYFSPVLSRLPDMPLSTSDKLGRYEILAPIAAGGTGELYGVRSTEAPVFA